MQTRQTRLERERRSQTSQVVLHFLLAHMSEPADFLLTSLTAGQHGIVFWRYYCHLYGIGRFVGYLRAHAPGFGTRVLEAHRCCLWRVADLEEYERFLASATRDAVKETLRIKLAECRTRCEQRRAQLRVIADAKAAAAAAPAAAATAGATLLYDPISSFSWDEVRTVAGTLLFEGSAVAWRGLVGESWLGLCHSCVVSVPLFWLYDEAYGIAAG